MRTARDRGKESGGLMVATIQLAITLGASVGGVLFDLKGHQGTFVVSAVVLLVAAVLAVKAPKPSPRCRQRHP